VTTTRFGAGGARAEDGPLLVGNGRFTADLSLPGQAHAAFLRSNLAHARIRSIDCSTAASMPGVIAILTGQDVVDAGLGPIPPALAIPGRGGKPMFIAAMPILAVERVRYVGEPIAIVIATTALAAADAAERITVELDPLPVAPSIETALTPGASAIHAGAPDNIALDWVDGDEAAIAAVLARAAHVERVRLADTRVAPSAMEPRAALASYDAATGRYTLIAPTQGVGIVRKLLAEAVLKVPLSAVRVLTHDVGGGFGMKAQTYSEYGALLFAAKKLGRAVSWVASRLESFLGDTHGRDSLLEAELALDAAGRFLGLRVTSLVGIGAYTTTFSAIFTTNNTKNCLSSVYQFPMVQTGVKVVLTNAAPLGPYRGAGRPEAIYLIERLIDAAAVAMNIDRVALRRRNMIRPDQMPYRAATGVIYDSGEFERVLDRALELADWRGFEARRTRSAQAGKLRGIGLCSFLEVAGGILDETADLRFEADGKVALRTGAQAMGQSHLSTFPQIVAARLGIDVGAVRLIQGDSDEVPAGTPSVASRSTMMAGSATVLCCDDAIAKGKPLAAQMLEAAAGDIEFRAGWYRVAGTDRGVGILELARSDVARNGVLNSIQKFVSPQMTYPNGCHVCEVEIDPDTGLTTIVNYAAVDDVGTILIPSVVDGQIHGGVAQGLGQVLGEFVRYDDHGQLLTASFMDYFMPRADDMPPLAVAHHSVPATTNPLGVKGAGESGVAGSLPAAMNAIIDALRPATRHADTLGLPADPQAVWKLLAAAR
jgi:aerobic carbon-monoxide dehydrogenase large subunit